MKEQIYQNGFYLLLGLFLGVTVTFVAIPKSPKTDIIKIELKQDSIKTKLKQDSIKSVKEYTSLKSLNEQNLKEELKRHKIPHSDIVLAQAKLESGIGKSDVYKKTNNLFGIKKGKNYKSYRHWTDCVKDYKRCISNHYKGGDYYAFLSSLPYAEDPNYIEKLKQLT